LNYVQKLSGPKHEEKLASATKFHSVAEAKAVSHIIQLTQFTILKHETLFWFCEQVKKEDALEEEKENAIT